MTDADLTFKGWWEEAEKDDSPEPWETFRVALIGIEAGDIADDPELVRRILDAAGMELVLRERGR